MTEQAPAPQLEPRPYWQLLAIGAVAASACVVQSSAMPLLALLGFFLAGAIVLRVFHLDGRLASLFSDASDERLLSSKERVFWPTAGFVGVATALGLLEWTHPYYFTQDENLAQYLPVVLQACRSFFAGVFPTWNPYQFMGSPTVAFGWYALTYPFTYIAYWFARAMLRNENATIEVFSCFHLLLGYLAIYWVIRREQVRPWLATLASSSCALAGFALISTRSTFNMGPIYLWTALMIVGVQELVRGRTSWKWILAFGGAMGLYFHAGHVQMWTYSVLLIDIAIAVLALAGAIGVRELLAALSAHFIGISIAAPLLVPQFAATQNVAREADATGIWAGLSGLLVPVSVSSSPDPMGWGTYPLGEMYYSGTLFILVCAVLLLSLLATRWSRPLVISNVWFVCALLAFILALGDRGLLWNAMALLPGFNRFRWAFKFLAFVVLFSAVGGAAALERLMRNRRWSPKLQLAVGTVFVGVLAYHCSLCTSAYYNYGFAPYPKLDPDLAAALVPSANLREKVLPIGAVRSPDPSFAASMKNEWPTYYQVFSLSGDDDMANGAPVVQRMLRRVLTNPARALPEYGAKYIVQYDQPGKESESGTLGAPIVYRNKGLTVYEVPNPKPIAFPLGSPDIVLPVEFDGHGANIDTTSFPDGGWLVFNMLWRHEVKASSSRSSELTAGPDEWERIRINVPPGCPRVRIDFDPPWRLGWLLAGLSLLAALGLGWVSQGLDLRGNAPQTALSDDQLLSDLTPAT